MIKETKGNGEQRFHFQCPRCGRPRCSRLLDARALAANERAAAGAPSARVGHPFRRLPFPPPFFLPSAGP